MAEVIEVTGVQATIRALQAFDPETRKALRKSIKESLEVTQRKAKSEYPAGAWRISVFNRNKTTGLSVGKISAAKGARRNPWNTSDPGVRAAIFEFAGTSTASRRPQVVNMVKSLNSRYGSPGRFLWDAWDSGGSSKLDDIASEIRTVEARLQSMMNAAG